MADGGTEEAGACARRPLLLRCWGCASPPWAADAPPPRPHPLTTPYRLIVIALQVTYTRKRIRSGKRDKLENDHSISTCSKCGAFKKKHVLLHCPSAAENCGFPKDTYIVRMPWEEKPKWIKSVTAQRHGVPWNGKFGAGAAPAEKKSEEQE